MSLCIQSDKAGEHGEEGGEDARLENGEVDEVVNYNTEDAAKQGGGGEACVLQVIFFGGSGLQGFYEQSEADGEGGGGGHVGSKQDEKFFIESFRGVLGQYKGAKDDNDHRGDDGAEGGEVCEPAVWRGFEGFRVGQ